MRILYEEGFQNLFEFTHCIQLITHGRSTMPLVDSHRETHSVVNRKCISLYWTFLWPRDRTHVRVYAYTKTSSTRPGFQKICKALASNMSSLLYLESDSFKRRHRRGDDERRLEAVTRAFTQKVNCCRAGLKHRNCWDVLVLPLVIEFTVHGRWGRSVVTSVWPTSSWNIAVLRA